ncbi:hypothetical protein PSPO01_15270 [Paraphaeosphaeria sporulosa]
MAAAKAVCSNEEGSVKEEGEGMECSSMTGGGIILPRCTGGESARAGLV